MFCQYQKRGIQTEPLPQEVFHAVLERLQNEKRDSLYLKEAPWTPHGHAKEKGALWNRVNEDDGCSCGMKPAGTKSSVS